MKTWETFHPERDIRQGDLNSPIIFILCAEYLGRYIHFMSALKNFGIWIKLTKDSPAISYLMFARDA